ncbi:DUF3040 domain-containing protein [Saxibacter everestensis]|uniref:DUF3040 domain-containing protein n=1 Tax=Saxibacter everestensis TaxID=2909229 RepID=A0ABY8QY57_9MICO|nr:DUF3040 domain-containing protein [Brevibacteriaceae bacterium ZFBP1038]
MPLSEHEQRLLEQLEQQLQSEDPKFANNLGSSPKRSLSARRLTLGILIVVVGLLIVVLAVSQNLIPLGVVGFVAMLAGVSWALSKPKGAIGDGAPVKPATPGARTMRTPTSGSGFMGRLEERWDRRRDNRG